MAQAPTPTSPIGESNPDAGFTVVDVHPVRRRTLHQLLVAQIAEAHKQGRTPFVELGGSSCGVCHALHRRLDAHPIGPHVRAAFAGTYIIRVAIEEWEDSQAAVGVDSLQRVPAYLAVDPDGHVTHILNVDYWMLRALDSDGSSQFRAFFRNNPLTAQSATAVLPLPASITVPFDVFHGFILVAAEVDGHKGTFVLDTGSPVIAVNGEYLQRSSTDALDTVTTPDPQGMIHMGHVPITVHTVTIGTMRYAIDPADKGPPVSFPANTYIAYDKRFNASGDRPILGFLGLPALEPFEVIVDYPHKQLTLIRLDSAGKRQADVKRFTVAATAPLVQMNVYWWGVQATLGDSLTHVFLVDTGCPFNTLHTDTRTALGTHITDAGMTPISNTQPDGTAATKDQQSWSVDHVALGSHTITTTASRFIHLGDHHDEILGNAFLQQLKVVGFNFRTHHLMIYR